MLVRTTGGPPEEGRRMYFSAGERIVVAEITEAVLLEPARRLFSAYETARPGHPHADRVDVILTRQSGSYLVASVDSPDVLCKTRMDAIAAFEFALSRSLAAALASYVHLHASGSVVDGKAVLALGSSGAGKSSLAISMLSKGFPTLGDDTVLLNSSAIALPFKRLFKATPASIQALGIDPSTTIMWDPDWLELWYDPDDGAGWVDEAPVAVIAFVRYEPSASMALTSMSKAEALNTVVHSLMDTGKRAKDCFDTLARLVDGARVFRLEYPSVNEAAEALSSLMR